MKQVVADAAIKEIKSGMILGLGSGSTAALMIKAWLMKSVLENYKILEVSQLPFNQKF